MKLEMLSSDKEKKIKNIFQFVYDTQTSNINSNPCSTYKYLNYCHKIRDQIKMYEWDNLKSGNLKEISNILWAFLGIITIIASFAYCSWSLRIFLRCESEFVRRSNETEATNRSESESI